MLIFTLKNIRCVVIEISCQCKINYYVICRCATTCYANVIARRMLFIWVQQHVSFCTFIGGLV